MSAQSTSSSGRGVALIVLDLISDYGYPGGRQILAAAQRVARRVSQLKRRVRRQRIPVIYVNDTRGHWESDQTLFVRRCLDASAEAAALVERILPGPEDYFIFKPRHSAFYATPLKELLSRLNVDTILLTGITSHECVLFTAIDAHVRKLNVIIARDCIAAPTPQATRHALFILEHSVDAHILDSRYIRFSRRR